MARSISISVVLPVWNGARYVAGAIASILAQDFRDFELIVVDDGSTDGTPDRIRKFNDPRIRLLIRPHQGLVPALNFGIQQARAEWIVRQDADDVSVPQRLRWQWAAHLQHPGAILFHGRMYFIDSSGQRVDHCRFGRMPRSHALLRLSLCIKCPIVHSSVMFNRTAYQRAGGYIVEDRHAEDFGLWGRMVPLGRFVGLRRSLLGYRIRAKSVSRVHTAEQIMRAERLCREHCRVLFRVTPEQAEQIARLFSSRNHAWRWLKLCHRYCVAGNPLHPEVLCWMIYHLARRMVWDIVAPHAETTIAPVP